MNGGCVFEATWGYGLRSCLIKKLQRNINNEIQIHYISLQKGIGGKNIYLWIKGELCHGKNTTLSPLVRCLTFV